MIELPTVREARLYERKNGLIECLLCAQNCKIPLRKRGFCNTRLNEEGKLYTLIYGDIVACESRPMEIKPFFHFYPGKTTMTFCAPSCNLRCQWCQNNHLSRREPRPLKARHVPPEEILTAAEACGDIGVCASFTEPTLLFEYLLDLFPITKERDMVNTMVSNGYMSARALEMLVNAGLDAINVDVKGSDEVYRKYCSARKGDSPPWETIRHALNLGVHVEVVHLVVTGLNDNVRAIKEVCEKHLRFASPDVPLHITAYFPACKYNEPPTSVDFLKSAWHIAKSAGIKFAYMGNVGMPPFENTYCPNCGALLIKRSAFRVLSNRLKERKCPSCSSAINIVL